jgi:uncharacterized protein YfdQ (DUF2303 family)
MAEETVPIRTEYDAAFEQGRGSAAKVFHVEGVPHLVYDKSQTLYNGESLLPRPRRLSGYISLTDAASFIEYVTSFSDDSTRLFFDKQQIKLTAALDYHLPGGVPVPSWKEHACALTFTHSTEWKTWIAKNRHQFKQEDFADFIEENQRDVTNPEAAIFLELAMHLEGTKKVKFTSGKRLDSGAAQLEYIEDIETKGKGNIKVPPGFEITIPIFEGADPQIIAARLRYRISDAGQLTFAYALDKPETLVENAVTLALASISETLGMKILRGTYR